MEDSLERKALEKWYLVSASGQDAWPEGFDLRSVIKQHRLLDMKLVLEIAAPTPS